MIGYGFTDEELKEIRNTKKKQSEARKRKNNIKYPKFTDENRDIILKSVRLGLPPSEACACAGIGKSTLKNWLAKGEISEDDDDPFRKFYLEVMKANADYMAKLIRYTDASNNPKIALELLKLRYPQYYSTKKNVEVSADVNSDINIGEKRDRLRRMMDKED